MTMQYKAAVVSDCVVRYDVQARDAGEWLDRLNWAEEEAMLGTGLHNTEKLVAILKNATFQINSFKVKMEKLLQDE